MNPIGWSLEVVRGREVGRSYALSSGDTVLGNALNGSPGLDLGPQEGDGPRRMAGRQAQIESTATGLVLRDLDSPGGTFVNRQRLLPGQARPLVAGDLIQVGGVQLKVTAAAPTTPPAPRAGPAPKPAPAPKPEPAPPPAAPATARPVRSNVLGAPFILASGASCRSWDDFLTVSAQRWGSLRDELVSGRLAAHLAASGNAHLAPSPEAPGTADERLDAWLAALPTTKSSQPELDVHPETLTVRATPGGGLTRQVLAITNTGYRLLRTTVRVEPAAASWIRVAREFSGAPFVTVDRTEVPLDVMIPDDLAAPMTGVLEIDGNGGSKRVTVRLERLAPPESIPELSSAIYGTGGPDLLELVARQPRALRFMAGSAGGFALRLLVALGGLLPLGSSTLGLPGPLLVFAALGCALAAIGTARRGESRDVPATMFAGGFAGVLGAALVVAACRALEPALGLGTIAACVLWTLLGAGVAGLSLVVLPPPAAPEPEP